MITTPPPNESPDRPAEARPGYFTALLDVLRILLLAGILLVFCLIYARLGEIGKSLGTIVGEGRSLTAIEASPVPVPGTPLATSTASGNVVHVTSSGGDLRPGPRTVEDVASYLGVTADTVRDSYIPEWIESGHMTEEDRLKNRWMIPDTFEPYKPK